MLRSLIGDGSLVSVLKTGLGDSHRRMTGIAHRIANATTPGFQDFPAISPDGGPAVPGPVDVQTELVSLADEQIRFDAAARLLRMNYDAIRVTMKQG